VPRGEDGPLHLTVLRHQSGPERGYQIVDLAKMAGILDDGDLISEGEGSSLMECAAVPVVGVRAFNVVVVHLFKTWDAA